MIPADTLRDLYVTQQLSVRQIADQCGTVAENIRLWLKRAGIETRSKSEGKQLRSPYKNLWTPERDAIIREMWGQGLAGHTIAKKIGCGVTKSAVTGRARRIGLPPHAKRPLSMTAEAIRKREETKRHNRQTMGQQQPAISHRPKPRIRSIVTFLPESPRLEMEFRHLVAEVRAERGGAWTELLGVERSQARWGF